MMRQKFLPGLVATLAAVFGFNRGAREIKFEPYQDPPRSVNGGGGHGGTPKQPAGAHGRKRKRVIMGSKRARQNCWRIAKMLAV